MSETAADRTAYSAPPHGQFAIKKIYVKDMSFETPNSPQIFQQPWEPEMDVHLHSHSNDLKGGEYEVVLVVTAVATLADKTAYLAEASIAGIFGITGLASDELGPTLGSYCPGILFPYAREFISNMALRAGFPSLILAPVDFEQLYRKHLSKQFSQQQAQIES